MLDFLSFTVKRFAFGLVLWILHIYGYKPSRSFWDFIDSNPFIDCDVDISVEVTRTEYE